MAIGWWQVQPETVRQFYAEACTTVHAQDPDTPCLIGGAPFYHADTLEIVLLTDQPNTICTAQRIKHSPEPAEQVANASTRACALRHVQMLSTFLSLANGSVVKSRPSTHAQPASDAATHTSETSSDAHSVISKSTSTSRCSRSSSSSPCSSQRGTMCQFCSTNGVSHALHVARWRTCVMCSTSLLRTLASRGHIGSGGSAATASLPLCSMRMAGGPHQPTMPS